MVDGTETKTCPECDRDIEAYQFDGHVEKCDGAPAMVDVTDGCPMCGRPYDEWLTHLQHECDRGDRDENGNAPIKLSSD
jgi:hypothetical protein